MRAICCAILGYIIFYISKNVNKEKQYNDLRGFLALLSIIFLIGSVILMILGL